jgi:hypothetical protein
MSPPERQPVLVIDANAVASGPITPQELQPVARGDCQVLQTRCDVQHLELPPDDRPDCAGNPSGRARVALAKQIRRRFIAEGLDHEI